MVLSGFIKKMLFARQFNIEKGAVTLLGTRKIIVAPELLNKIKNAKKMGKEMFAEEFKKVKKKYGLGEVRIIEFCFNLLESYGLGSFKLLKKEGGTAIIEVRKSPFKKCGFTEGALESLFELVMGKCKAKETQCASKGKSTCHFKIKKV